MTTRGSSTRIYLDHAASSWPKPQEVVEAMHFAMTELGGNPGRGVYDLAMRSARAVFESRNDCARLLGVSDSANIIFVPSCTFGCNTMLFGLLAPGDRVVVGSMEHNAIARPLNALADRGVEVVTVAADVTGFIDPDDVEAAVRPAPTKAVVCQHANNVTGTVQPIADLADIAHECGALMLVDGAQAAGHLEVDLEALGVDAWATAGHKGLLGPQGVGLLYLAPHVDPSPLIEGGSGSGDSRLPRMPLDRPDRYEAGTLNTPGIAGIGAAARWHLAHGAEQRAEEQRLIRLLRDGLSAIDGLTVIAPPVGAPCVPVLSFTHAERGADEIAFELDRRFGIATRAGLHCSPWSHETMETARAGAVRMGVGFANTEHEVGEAVEAVATILGSHGRT